MESICERRPGDGWSAFCPTAGLLLNSMIDAIDESVNMSIDDIYFKFEAFRVRFILLLAVRLSLAAGMQVYFFIESPTHCSIVGLSA